MTSLLDEHISRRIRRRRKFLGVRQSEVAAICGISYQQVNKFESALSRVLPDHLFKLAQALHVEVGYFFEDFEEKVM